MIRRDCRVSVEKKSQRLMNPSSEVNPSSRVNEWRFIHLLFLCANNRPHISLMNDAVRGPNCIQNIIRNGKSSGKTTVCWPCIQSNVCLQHSDKKGCLLASCCHPSSAVETSHLLTVCGSVGNKVGINNLIVRLIFKLASSLRFVVIRIAKDLSNQPHV